MSDSFYLVLPANASGSEFPENSNSSFKVRLDKRLRLEGTKWECALVDMFYMNNWHNITEGYMNVKTYTRHETSKEIQEMVTCRKVQIRKGRYRTISELIEEIHNSLQSFDLHGKIVFFHDQIRNLMFLIINHKECGVELSQDLAEIFGFKSNHLYIGVRGEESFMSSMAPDLHQGFTSLYIYCSLCENRLVGDSSVRLLRVLPVRKGKDDRNVYEEVRNPHYTQVANTDTDVVEIHISRDDGREVSFKGGKVIVTLHLRRIE
jgi:hypothetical protein